MLRSLLVGVLALSAFASCKSDKSDTPAVAAATAPAGKVIELTGKVEATRSGKTRELAVGAEVYADDQVSTAADATVTIELFHNNARWAVTSNKQARVDASLAWGLDKQQASKSVEHNSASAGREAERSAAETRDTAAESMKKEAPEAAPAAAPMAAEPPAVGAAPPQEEAKPVAPPPPPPPPAPERESAPVRRDAPKAGKSSAGGGAVSTRGLPGGASLDADARVAARAQLDTLLAGQRAALKRCLAADAATPVTIFVSVTKGRVVIAGKTTVEARACMQKVIEKLDIATLTASTSLELR